MMIVFKWLKFELCASKMNKNDNHIYGARENYIDFNFSKLSLQK